MDRVICLFHVDLRGKRAATLSTRIWFHYKSMLQIAFAQESFIVSSRPRATGVVLARHSTAPRPSDRLVNPRCRVAMSVDARPLCDLGGSCVALARSLLKNRPE